MRRIVSVFPLSLAVGCASIYGDSNALDPLPPSTTEHLARPTRTVVVPAPTQPDRAEQRTLDHVGDLFANGFQQSRVLFLMMQNPHLSPEAVDVHYRFIDTLGGGSATHPMIDDVQRLFTRSMPVITIPLPNGYDRICLQAIPVGGRAHQLGWRPIYVRIGLRGATYQLPIRRISPNGSVALLDCIHF